MKIIIIGAGFTGTQLAKRLISERNDVVLIDSDEETVRHVSNRLDCMVIQASGNSLTTLEEAGIDKADALVALTESDELNMITCSLVDSVYPNVTKIARVRNYDYYINTEKKGQDRPVYGIDYMIHPDIEAAEAIVAAVKNGAVTDVIDFENSAFELTRIAIQKGSKLDGIAVQDIRKHISTDFLLAFIEQGNQTSLPSGATVLHADTRLGIICRREEIPNFLELCGSEVIDIKKIALVGAGRIGTKIADQLLSTNKTSKLFHFLGMRKKINEEFVIIDSDKKRAKEASERFPSANVYRADITDEGFIEEEDLSSFDLVITATHNHELNMVTSAYMKSLGVSKTICLVLSGSYGLIARNIGIDVAVPIKDVIVDSILSHLRGKSVTGIHTVSEGELEILEFVLLEDSAVIGKQIKHIAEPGSFLILLIQEKGKTEFIVPSGDTTLEVGDKLVVIAYIKDNKHIMNKFGVGE